MAPVVSMAPREAAAPRAARGPGGLARAQDGVGDCALPRQAGMAWQAGRRRPGPRPGPARCGRRRPRIAAVGRAVTARGGGSDPARGLRAGYRPASRPSLGLRAPRPAI
ncbi:hypothetical protein ACRRTK_016173 [Alexandromys fortis]